MNNDQFDSNMIEGSVDLSNPPENMDVPLDSYPYDTNELDRVELSELSLQEALGQLTPAEIQEAPPEMLEPANFSDEEDNTQTPVSKFLLDQISQIDAEARLKNPNAKPIDLQTAFPKNTQTQWFADYNAAALDGNAPGKKLVSKLNGFFFTAEEDPTIALQQFGLRDDLIKDYAQHFDMSYFGNTKSRTKNNGNSNGFKSYVMHLKDPTNPESLKVLDEVMAAKHAAIQAKLDRSYDLDKAVEHLTQKAHSIIDEEVKKTGVVPFVGSDESMFLNPGAIYAEIKKKVPEVDGLYAIEPLASKGNKVTYSGYSESLESYFEDDLKICKLTTLDPVALPQEKLEQLVAEKLELGTAREHLASTPTEALIQQIKNLSDDPAEVAAPAEAAPKQAATPNDNVFPMQGGKQNRSQDRSGFDNDEYGDDSHFNRRKRGRDNEVEEPDSLAKITLESLSKITQATLAAIIALAQLIMQTLMALLQALARMCGMNIASPSKLPDNPLLTYNKVIDRMKVSNGPAQDVENTKDLKPEDAIADLTNALDEDIANDEKLKSEYELSDVKPLDKIQLSKEALQNLSAEDRARLDKEADLLLSNLSDEDRKYYLDKIEIKAEHAFAADLDSKLSEPLVYDERFGVLLATADKVEFNGEHYGVVSAAVVGGELLYAIAKDNESGNYDINFVKAGELTLKEHNAINFDNLANLKNHIAEQLLEKFPAEEGKIEKLAILDRADLKGHEITIAELNNQTSFISFDKLGFDTTPISVDELIKDNHALVNELYYSLPQLHHDKTGELNASTKKNSHPFFGRMLDLNDLVDAKLSNGDISIRGSVIGAYEANTDLYYQLMHEGQLYSVKADEVSLIAPNGGNLSDEQLALASSTNRKGKAFRKEVLPAEHASIANAIKLLAPNDEAGFDQSFQYESSNSIIRFGNSNLGVVPLNVDDKGAYIGAGKLITMPSNDGTSLSFMTFGETTNPVDGMKRAIAFEVENTLVGLRPKAASNSRMVQINLDDPELKITTAGINNEDLKAFARQARNIYENGSLRRVASVVGYYANEAKARLLGEDNQPLKIAREAFVQNKVAMGILQEKAGLTPQAPLVDVGLKANLANSTFFMDQVSKIIESPESRSYTPSQGLATSNPVDIVSYSMNYEHNPVMPMSVNELISNYSPLMQPSVAGVENVDTATSVVAEPVVHAAPKETLTYQGVNLDQLSAVRVQRGLDGINVEDGKLVLKHNMNNKDSVRNTMHFALNGHVNDHGYGKFNDASFAIIAPLAALAEANALGGVGAADTWVYAKENEIVIPQATLVMPSHIEIPEVLQGSDIKILQYEEGASALETLANRNAAITQELAERDSPQFNINMHNWDGVQFSHEDQLALSQRFGYSDALPSNHESSPDGQLETVFSQIDSLVAKKLNGESEYYNSNNGQWYLVDDKLDVLKSEVSEIVNRLPNEDVRQHYLAAMGKRMELMNNSVQLAMESMNNQAIKADVQLEGIRNEEAKKLASLASAYVSGNPQEIEKNPLVLELLSEKNRITESYTSLQSEAAGFNSTLQAIGLAQINSLSETEIGLLKDALSSENLSLHLDNLRDSVDDFSNDFSDHIQLLNQQLMDAGENVPFSTLDEQSSNALIHLNESLQEDIRNKAQGVDQVQNLVQKMEFINQNTVEEIHTHLPSFEMQDQYKLQQQIEKLGGAFTPQNHQDQYEQRKSLNSSLDNSY